MRAVIILLFLTLLTAGCGKTQKEPQTNKLPEKEQQDTENDTASLTPAESFAASLTQDILNDDSEVELESYLAEKVYPLVSGSAKVTIDKISSSLYLLKYYNGNAEKNLLIQKYYIPAEDRIEFEMTETGTNNLKQYIK